MSSLADFRAKLKNDTDVAMNDYCIIIDGDNLDYTTINGQVAYDEFKEVDIVFEYRNQDGKNVIFGRPKLESDTGGQRVSYLPWKNKASGSVAKATLDGGGPRYFLTSQLDGCRFTFQYHDADRKRVTVLHLAGDHGDSGKDGSAARDVLEENNLPDLKKPGLKRRFSIGGGIGKTKNYKLGRQATTYYGGGMGTVFGYRNNAGAWVFYGLDIFKRKGEGLFNLGTGSKVTGSINENASQ